MTSSMDLVTKLVDTHVAESLRSYQSNLTFAVHTSSKAWLPPQVEPCFQQHIAALQRHLEQNGHPESDSFLLRLGLTVPGVRRGIVPPLMVLDENRGGFSARRIHEAEGQILRLREALAIGRRFLTGLSDDTQQAVVELADFSQAKTPPGDLDWLRWFRELSSEDAERLAVRAIEYLDCDQEPVNEIGLQILQRLARFRQSPLNEVCCNALLDRDAYWPSILYRDSGNAIADRLVSRIDECKAQGSLNHCLLALGWTRSVSAQEAFRRWTVQRPEWVSELYVPPEDYLHSAGWCLEDNGGRQDLIFTTCFRLMAAEGMTRRSVRCRSRANEECPSCGGPLAWLFDFTKLGAEYFPNTYGEAPRKVLCCLHCSCFGPVFAEYHADGNATWLSPFEPCKFEYSRVGESCVRVLEDAPCPPFACAEAGMNDSSTLGGIPTWLQDAEFPRCIECGELMMFLAQLDNGSLGEEGIHYAFFCPSCHVSAVTYQQT